MSKASVWTVDWKSALIMHGGQYATTASDSLMPKWLAISLLALLEKVRNGAFGNFSSFITILHSGAQAVVPRATLREGPIFLDQLFCSNTDQTLQECSSGIRAIGLTTCNHSEDVWVQCSGTAK